MIWRIRHRKTFDELRARGTRVRSGPVRMTYVPCGTEQPMVAFAFGRRFGSAVERNRARRRLRAAFETAWCPGDPLGAYQLTGSRSLLTYRFDPLVDDLRRCFERLASGPTPTAVTAGRVR